MQVGEWLPRSASHRKGLVGRDETKVSAGKVRWRVDIFERSRKNRVKMKKSVGEETLTN